MSLRVNFSHQFESELDANITWYELREPGLGARFEQDVYATLLRVKEFPESAALWRANFRSVRLRSFNHAIVYELDPECVYVVGLFHGAQDPESWD